MTLNSLDTIVALASAPGAGARAIVRLSGPSSIHLTTDLFFPPPTRLRGLSVGKLRLEGISAALPATLYLWPTPHSYTGQEMAEIHTISSPPLLELLIAQLLRGGARAARPGEFTMRAFLAGKIDLTRAEAVHAVIDACDRDELKRALSQLAGGMAQPLAALREDLLNLLADIEAGLDFGDEDIRFVEQKEMLLRLGNALAQVMLLRRQLDSRGQSNRPFRVVLVGKPNAGKSSLFNALTGSAALVSPIPGTTRDYLIARLDLGGVTIELVDTAGFDHGAGDIEAQAQGLARDQSTNADLIVLCLAADMSRVEEEDALLSRLSPSVLAIATRADLTTTPTKHLPTSSLTGLGLDQLRSILAERATARKEPALAPSLSRCRHHVETCLANLRRAHAIVLEEDPPELLALELRLALEQLGEMVGAVYTEDLLDRIFSRFCIGK